MEESYVELLGARQRIEVPRSAHNQYLRCILRSGSELASESGLMMLGSLQEHEQNSDCGRPVRV